MLGIVRSVKKHVLTALFNLSGQPVTLSVTGKARATGPQNGMVNGQTISLPAWGYVYLESTTAIGVTRT